MNLELTTAVKELELKYNVVGKFYFSNFFTPTGKKDLHDWLRNCYQEKFEPNDRILVIQDSSDVYEYDDLPGMIVTALQQFVAKVDISNCFILVVTQNAQIKQELAQCNELFCKSSEPIGSYLVPGESFEPAQIIPKNTFCAAPWAHLYIGTDGNVLPCCAGNPIFPLGNVEHSSIEEIMNSPATIKLRKNMMAGKRSKECSSCYYKEDNNLSSLREQFNDNFKDAKITVAEDGSFVNFQPLTLDIRLNKICNLKCRSCGPYYSSAIAQEFQEIYKIKDVVTLNNQQRQRALLEVMAYLPKIKGIYFGGGEPLLAQENYNIMLELILLNQTDIDLQINTNFTTLHYKNYDLIEIFKKFKLVKLCASLDAYGATASYVRHGTDWAVIEKNLTEVMTKCNNVELTITSTVGLTNVESLIELQKTWHNQGLLHLSKFKISQIITDSMLSLQVLPNYHKERLSVIIRKHATWCSANNAPVLEQEWLDVLNFMTAQDQSHLLSEFVKNTQLLDSHRNESFSSVFPQYADLLNYT